VKPRRKLPTEPRLGVSRHVVRILLAVFISMALVDGVFGQRGVLGNRQLRATNQRMQESVEALRATNVALREKTRRLREDPSAIDELARRELGLMKEDELVIILKDVSAATPTLQSKDGVGKKKR
jgi:cell division protein FtsB